MVPTIRPMIAALAALLPAFLLLQAPCGGQTNSAGDVRLTPEIRDYTVPEEAKMESTARIGGRQMGIWGTPVFNADSSEIINELRMTVFDGDRPLFAPVVPHSPEARPYGTANVIPAAGSYFLLVWSDRREKNPGLYIKRFDTAGLPLDTEQRLDIATDRLRNDTANRPKLDGTLLRFSAFPEWSFVQIDSLAPFIIRSSGAIDTRLSAISDLHAPYYLAEDTSVVTLSGKEIRFFRTLWDTTPRQTLEIPWLDSALTNSEIIMRETGGSYSLIFAVVSDPFSKACRYWKVTFADTGYSDPVFLWKEEVPVYVPYDGAPPDPSKPYECRGATRERGCDNSYNLIVRYLAWIGFAYQGFYNPGKLDNLPFQILIDRSGTLRRGGYPNPSGDVFPFQPCESLTDLNIGRRLKDSVMTISITTGGDSLFSAISSLPYTRPATPRSRPNVFPDNDVLVVKWDFDSDPLRPQSAGWLGYDEPPSASSVREFSALDAMSLHAQADYKGKEESRISMFSYDGRPFAYTIQNRTDTAIVAHSQVPLPVSQFILKGLTKDGWKVIYTGSGSGSSWIIDGQETKLAPQFVVNRIAFNPESRQFYASVTSTQRYPGLYNSDIIKTTNFVHSFFTGKTDGVSIDSFPAFSPPMRRLAENAWLTFFPSGDGTQEWIFRIRDRDDNRLKEVRLRLEGDPSSISIAQNYTDKSLAVLWGSAAGVKGTFLNYALEPLAENVSISETADSVSGATGCYRNDTLFVVWEDYRHNGVANIYGTSFTAPKASDVEEEKPADISPQTMRARFDRASGTILIEFGHATESPVRIELFDIFGNRAERLTADAGTRVARIDAGRLASGTYLVRARTDGPRCYDAISHVTR